LAEIGQKMDFRALFSEIYIKIEVFTSLELGSVGSMLDIFHLNMARPDLTREGAGSIPP
jgi:hypothetical protein